MRAYEIVAVAAAWVAYASALPWFGFGAGHGCLTKDEAHELVQNFIQLSNGDSFDVALARELLTEDVVDTSGSVASVINGGIAQYHLKISRIQC